MAYAPENNIMSMIPNTTHTKKWEGVVAGLRNAQGAQEAGQSRNAGGVEGDS